MPVNYGYSGVAGVPTNEEIVEKYLRLAETFFNKRRFPVTKYAILVLRGPHTYYDTKTNEAIIEIPDKLSDADRDGLLAQESIHIYSPASPGEATVFDMALATKVSRDVGKYNLTGDPKFSRYQDALKLIDSLCEKCPDSLESLLKKKDRICLVEADDILNVCPEYEKAKATELTKNI